MQGTHSRSGRCWRKIRHDEEERGSWTVTLTTGYSFFIEEQVLMFSFKGFRQWHTVTRERNSGHFPSSQFKPPTKFRKLHLLPSSDGGGGATMVGIRTVVGFCSVQKRRLALPSSTVYRITSFPVTPESVGTQSLRNPKAFYIETFENFQKLLRYTVSKACRNWTLLCQATK